jgi:hypothetical protein
MRKRIIRPIPNTLCTPTQAVSTSAVARQPCLPARSISSSSSGAHRRRYDVRVRGAGTPGEKALFGEVRRHTGSWWHRAIQCQPWGTTRGFGMKLATGAAPPAVSLINCQAPTLPTPPPLCPQDFGARDPFPAELESNFGDKVLGNYNTDHIIK